MLAHRPLLWQWKHGRVALQAAPSQSVPDLKRAKDQSIGSARRFQVAGAYLLPRADLESCRPARALPVSTLQWASLLSLRPLRPPLLLVLPVVRRWVRWTNVEDEAVNPCHRSASLSLPIGLCRIRLAAAHPNLHRRKQLLPEARQPPPPLHLALSPAPLARLDSPPLSINRVHRNLSRPPLARHRFVETIEEKRIASQIFL